jgi:probable F420-dependent oxidoreductase
MPHDRGTRHPRPFRFGVTAHIAGSGEDLRALSRKVEDLGFATLVVPDHFGDQLALVPTLACVLEATNRLRAGALVACNDFRHPVVHAKELATLDVLSEGRLDWGMGAGWFKPEYTSAGIPFDRPGVRVDRLIEAVTVMKSLFGAETTSYAGSHYTVTALDGQPKPVQRPHPPLLVGGAGRRMLTFAGREADIVGIAPSPAARGLPRGARRAPTVEESFDAQIHWVKAAAGARRGDIELSAVAYPALITDDPEGSATKLAGALRLDPPEVLASPHVWLGSVDRICDVLEARRERWGVSYWVVAATSVDGLAPVVARMAGR